MLGQVLHGSATTTEAVRRTTQHSQETLRTLAKRYGINQKTVAEWKKRSSVSDLPTGPKEPKSTVLGGENEAIIVAFRGHTLLPLDDCPYALQPTIPHLTRSSLHRCRSGMGSPDCLMSMATNRPRKVHGHEQLRRHLADFIAAYNFARRLKTLKGPTP